MKFLFISYLISIIYAAYAAYHFHDRASLLENHIRKGKGFKIGETRFQCYTEKTVYNITIPIRSSTK